MKFRLLYACSTSCLSVSAENIMWATWHTKTSNLLLRRKNNIYSHKSSKNYVELFCVSVYKQNKMLFPFFLFWFYSIFWTKKLTFQLQPLVFKYILCLIKRQILKSIICDENWIAFQRNQLIPFGGIEYRSQIKLNRHLYKRCIFEYFTGMHL